MSSIYDMMCKIPVIMHVAVACQAKLPMLPSFRDTAHSLQMVYYWLKAADDDLKAMSNSVELSTDTIHIRSIVPPTLIGEMDKMNFIQEKTSELAKMSLLYISSNDLPPVVQYKIQQGYTKIMEAMFNNDISKTHYEEYTRLKSTGEA